MSDPNFFQLVKKITKESGGDDNTAEVIFNRIMDRLDGYTHEEAVARNPLSEETE